MPTEAEWEFACRANSQKDFFWDEDYNEQDEANTLMGNYISTEQINGPNLVSQKDPNSFGLYDMAGNLEEWCHDWFDAYDTMSIPLNPFGPSKGTYKVLRGGNWNDRNSYYYRSGMRYYAKPASIENTIGFRTVCK